MTSRIAFITYETPFAPCGGVTAVMNSLPYMIASISGRPTSIITPYHFKIKKTASLASSVTRITDFQVMYRSRPTTIEILEYKDRIQWIFLRALGTPSEEQPFFAGERHPYDVSTDQTRLSSILTRDALFFGVASAAALGCLDANATWTILMQDWEAATIVLASRGKKPPSPHYFHLTLHNSYDSGLQAEMLKRFGLDPKSCPGETVLNRSLPFIKDPIFTVSGQYAQDLTSEVLQSRVLAPHLVDHLGSRLHGINNGAFTKLTVDQEIIEQARIGNYEKLRAWKDRKKEAAFAAITSFKSTNERPLWGKSSLFRTEETPWFIFAGRDDPRQKGYDVASSAITSYLEKGGQASFLFFPIPGDEGLSGLDFLRKLAFRFPESVLVLPAIFKEGFLAALQGSAFGVMPSFYEPFGMANEFYLNGCVAIGRATGGIIQQIVPIRSIHSFTKAVRGRADIWHTRNALPTGFLYREADRFSSNEVYWRAINTTDYQLNGSYPDRIERREQIPLFKAMAKALEDCINDAVSLYISQPQRYHQMLVNGIDFILNNFSWEHAAREYYQNLE